MAFVQEKLFNIVCVVVLLLAEGNCSMLMALGAGERPVNKQCEMAGPLDVVFALPGQTNPTHTLRYMSLIRKLVGKLPIGPTQVMVGVAPRQCPARSGFALREQDTLRGVQRALTRQLKVSTTPLYEMLEYLDMDAFSPEEGGRSDTSRAAVVFIEGPVEDFEMTLQAARALQQHVDVIPVGVGPQVSDRQLKAISSSYDRRFNVESVAQLETLLEPLMERLCQGAFWQDSQYDWN